MLIESWGVLGVWAGLRPDVRFSWMQEPRRHSFYPVSGVSLKG